MEQKLDNDLLVAAKAVVRAVIKNPPGFHNGNMTCQVPLTIFKKLEDAVKVAVMLNDSGELDMKESNLKPQKEQESEDDDTYSGFPISFV